MQMLGEIVATLRAANHWSLEDVAARVRQAGAKNVKYQHIQQLESKPNTSPRYIVELASAFGKSVEELRGWKPGMPPLGKHHAESKHGPAIRESAPDYHAAFRLNDDEHALIDAYRACPAAARHAIRTLAEVSAKSRRNSLSA